MRMPGFKFSIGTKLALSAGVGVVLTVAMVVNQQVGGSTTTNFIAAANLQQTITAEAIDAKASLRGMQVGVRDLRLARTAAEVQKAVANIESRQVSANGFVDSLLRELTVAEVRERVQ
jgi:hypothetical protein